MKSIQNKMKMFGITLALGMGLMGTKATAQYYQDYGQQGYNQQYGSAYYDDRYDYGDYQQFYDELAPHGNWMQDPTYGYVWSPRGVGRDFRPYYTNGRWAMSNMGNMWVSDYAWGSIPFHYGRWHFSEFHGWLWIPGSQWAPSWVVWRQGGGHYGWAPMGPGMNLKMNFGALNISVNLWNFIPMNHIYTGNYSRYRYSGYGNNYYQSTTIINNYYNHGGNRFFAGPRAQDVRRVVGRDITVYNVNTVNTRGRNRIQGNSITAYAPRVNRTQGRATGAPRQFAKIEENRSIRNEITRTTGQNRTINNRSTSPTRNTTPRIDNSRTTQNRNAVNNNTQLRSNDARTTNRPVGQTPAVNNRTAPMQNNNNIRNTQPRTTQPRATQTTTRQNRTTITNTNNTTRVAQPRATQSSKAAQAPRSMNTQSNNTRRSNTQNRATSPSRNNTQMRTSQPARSSNVSPARNSNNSRASTSPSRNIGGERGSRGGR